MGNGINVSIIYGLIALLSLLLASGYLVLVREKENWLIWLYFSVFIANLGYFTLAISKALEEALLANRLGYLGSVFLPLCMLMTLIKVCKLQISKAMTNILIGCSLVVFLITATQGYIDLYYKEVSLTFVDEVATLNKVYGPLHKIYYVYLFLYFSAMIGTIILAVMKKKIPSYAHAGVLAVVVLFNILIWLVEQFVKTKFEFLSVSYVMSSLLLLFLYSMIQDYDILIEQIRNEEKNEPVFDYEKLQKELPEMSTLSNREMEVFQMLLTDKKRKEIADELCITENTVKKHTSNIFVKLDVSSRAELLDKIKSI